MIIHIVDFVVATESQQRYHAGMSEFAFNVNKCYTLWAWQDPLLPVCVLQNAVL